MCNYQIFLYNNQIFLDNKIKREMAVRHDQEQAVHHFTITRILPATLYTVTIKTVCVFETLR